MAATKLIYNVQPNANLVAQPKLYAVDAGNSTDTAYTQTVSIDITPGVENYSARLFGTLTVPMVAGVGTFTGLTLPVNGTYTLTAISGTLTPAVSNSFVMSAQVERNALSEIRKTVRYRLGFLTDGSDEPADLTTIYPTAINEARDFCLLELEVGEQPIARETIEIPLVASQREYDFTRQGFLKVDMVDLGTATQKVRMLPYEEAPAMYLMGATTTTGTPTYFYMAGPGTIGVVPPPSTTGKSIYLTGTRVQQAMSADGDTTGLSMAWNSLIAVATAVDICSTWDMEQPEHQQRLGGLKVMFDAKMRQVKRLISDMTVKRGGFMVAQAVTDRQQRQRRAIR